MNRPTRLARLTPIVVLLTAAPLTAQNLAESAEGTSSVVLQHGGLAAVNFAEKSIKLGFTDIVSAKKWRLGAEFKAIASLGILSMFDEHRMPPEGRGKAFVGWLHDDAIGPITSQWMTAELAYDYARLSLASTSTASPVQRTDAIFAGTRVTGYYNALADIGTDLLVGLSAGYGKKNNYADLEKVSVCEAVAITVSPARTIQKCREARFGLYVESMEWSASSDILIYFAKLKNRVAIDLLARVGDASEVHPFDPGIGLFFTKPGSPLVILGGATLQWEQGRFPKAGLQAGISF